MDFCGCKIASQSRLLTGILTGTERWDGRGDAPSEGRRSGKPLSSTLGAEAERLARIGRKADPGQPDKNG
jgi:hypothetical protein